MRGEDSYRGGWCLWRGTWSGRPSIQCQGWVRFPTSALSTLSLLSPDFASLCGPPRIGQGGVRPQNRSWRRPPCQNHSDFTTHATCEHDTGARWKTACRNNSVTAPAIWNECSRSTSLDLVDPSPYSCQVWISPPHKHILSHMNPLDQSLINLQCFSFDCVWLMKAYLPCVRLTEISAWETAREEKEIGRSKMLGVDGIRARAGWEDMKKYFWE